MIRKRKSALDATLMIRPPKTAQSQNAFWSASSPLQRWHRLFIDSVFYECSVVKSIEPRMSQMGQSRLSRNANITVSFEATPDGVDGSRSRHLGAKIVVVIMNHEPEEPSAMTITTIGVDLAKNISQIHGVEASGEVALRRSLRRVSTAEQNQSKGRSKISPPWVKRYAVLRVVPVVHRRGPRCFV